MTRKEHLQWCKDRALTYLDNGQVAEGMASFTSDLTKHPETSEILRDPLAFQLCARSLMTNDPRACADCVNGFN